MISAQGITKRFGNLVAVDQVSFEVGKGELLGFIGPNGAGKTTTMRMLTGYLPTTEGKAVVAGHDVFESPMEVRRRVGYLPESPPLYTDLTIGAYLSFIAEIREVPAKGRARRVGEVMERVGLSGWEKRILGSLSKGYRQRVGLAQAVLHDPEVLILDEPTSGLDPAQMVGIREFIQDLARERTVILSTHILPQVELLCERVVMVARGRVVADGPLDEVREEAGYGLRYRVEVSSPDADAGTLAAAVGKLGVVAQVKVLEGDAQATDDGFATLEVRAPEDPRTAVASLATASGWQVRAMERHVPSLEEAFVSIVGREQ